MTGDSYPDKISEPGLPYRLEGGTDCPLLRVALEKGRALRVVCRSIVGMEGGLDVDPAINAIASRVMTEDNLLINPVHAATAGSVLIAPALPGHILHYPVCNEHIIYLKQSAFLASTPNLQLIRLAEPQGATAGTGLRLLQCKGTGDLWFNTYGAARVLDVDGEIFADADKIVAWTKGLTCRLAPLKGCRTAWLIGEGPGCHFQGHGRLWLQSHSSRALLHRCRGF